MSEWEPYRIVLDYEALQEGFLDRIEDLNTTLEQIDMAGDFSKGNAQKLLSKCPSVRGWDRTRRDRRILGWESLGKMLKGTGLALVLVVDDARFAPLKEQLAKRKNRRQPAIASIERSAWLINKDNAREMALKRWSVTSPAKRERMARKAAKARWKQRKMRLACDRTKAIDGTLQVDGAAASSHHAAATPRQCQMVLHQAKT